jgi:hypothetical protein
MIRKRHLVNCHIEVPFVRRPIGRAAHFRCALDESPSPLFFRNRSWLSPFSFCPKSLAAAGDAAGVERWRQAAFQLDRLAASGMTKQRS